MTTDDRRRLREARARPGWTPPGPVPPGDQGQPDLMPGPGETLDAFAGHWRLFQLRGGHRYSTDDLLGAWYAVHTLEILGRTPTRALDLGTGIGSVGMFLLWSFPHLSLTGVEAQAESLALARRSARFNGVSDRVRYVHADLRDWHESGFDLVTGSPPYWDPEAGTLSEGPQKGPCRFEMRGGLEGYCAAAARSLAPGGLFVVVFDGRQQPRLERAVTEAGLELLRHRPVISREGDPPLIQLAAMTRLGERPHDRIDEPPLLLRTADGKRTSEFRTLRQRMGLPPGPV